MLEAYPKVLASMNDKHKVALLKQLLKDEPNEKLRHMFVLEHSKISEDVGFIKLEIFNTEKCVFRAKIQEDASRRSRYSETGNADPLFNWGKLRIGAKKLRVGLVDFESESVWQKFLKGCDAAVKAGRIPFLSGLINLKLG